MATQDAVFQCIIISLISFFAFFGSIVLYTDLDKLIKRQLNDTENIKSKWKMIVYYIIDTGFVILITITELLTVVAFLSLILNIVKRFW